MGSISDEELEYLASDFEPASLTMPKLRAILVQHDIPYPASAKKAQLVDIFLEKVKPQAKKILSARARIRRTSKGITDMPSSQESTAADEEEADAAAMPPPSTRSKTPGRSRKSARTPDEVPEPPSTVKRTASRKSSTRKSKEPDADAPVAETPRPTVKKTRRSEVMPAIKVEEPELPSRPLDPNESFFTDDNPFQSGSSPLDGETRRRVSGQKSEKRKSTSGSRRKSVKQEDGNKSTYEIPVSRLPRSAFRHEDTIEPGEEFTAEEQQDLDRSVAKGETSVRPKKKNKRPSAVPKSAPWIVMSTLLAGMAAWYRNEKVEIGYCGIGKQVGALSEMEAPEWLHVLQPQCEPCPPHALCYEGMKVQCEPDFVLQQHPLSINGLVPLPPTCEPDSEKERKVYAVANRAVEELRDRRAKWECGELSEEDGSPATAVEIDEPKLKAEVSKKRRRGMSEREFEDLWKGAIGEIVGREEISSDGDGYTAGLRPVRLASSSLARLPLRCAIRRSIRQTLARYRIQAGTFLILLGLAAYGRRRVRAALGDRSRVPGLVSSTLDRLATQAALYAQGSAPEAFISMGQLRDDVLRDEFSIKRRDEIWGRVQKVVETNTNVRANVKESRNGEISRVWEWIGNLPVLEDGGWSGGDRRQSGGRYSVGPRAGSPVPGASGSKREEMMEVRKWDEGRPIY